MGDLTTAFRLLISLKTSIRLNLLALPSTSSASGAFAEVLSLKGTRSSEDVLRGGEPRVSNSGKVSTLVSVSVV